MKENRGVIVNYRLGPKRQYPRECLVMFPNRRDLGQLVGKRVVFRIRNKAFRGKVIALFGRKGRIVLCRFRKGLPSDVVGKEIEVL